MTTTSLSVDSLDFAPGLLAMQERPPARLPRLIFYVVSLLFLILLVWAMVGKLDIIASAEGRLIPQTFVKIVQPADSGIIRDILVTEGQLVTAGQLLMRMDTQLVNADTSMVEQEMAVKQLTLRRIDAELKDAVFHAPSGYPADLSAQIMAQYQAHRQAYQDAIAQEEQVKNRAKNDLLAARQILQKLVATVPVYQQTAASYEKLVREGFISELAAKDKLREKIEKEQDLKAQAANVDGLMDTIAQSDKKLAQIQSSYQSQLHNERVEAQSQLTKLQQELAKQKYKSSLLELKAPQAGIVKDLATHTQGTVVQPGTILMNLVPQDEPLLAEVAIKNEDVGFTQPGQTVKLKLAAYPFQKYGLLEGVVDHISADSFENNAAAANQPANKLAANNGMMPLNYKTYVKLTGQKLVSQDGTDLKMSPGMQVTAEIHQGQQTVMEYLLSPVQKVSHEAARER